MSAKLQSAAALPQALAPPVPQHVAIIMDGNGRWATARNKPRQFGHHRGVEAVRRCVEAAGDLGVRYLTLYSFSTENWRRPREEVKALFELMRSFVSKDLERLHKNRVCVRILGARDRLEPDIVGLIETVENRTRANDRLFLNIAFNYGGRDEITRACAALGREVRSGTLDPASITEADIARHLDTAFMSDPELVIRTSGEQRLSNFLLWQSAYSEFVVLDVMWPDFARSDFEEALRVFHNRDRRQGGICE